MPIDLERMRERYNDRFAGMELVAVEDLYWPVYRHDLRIITKEFVPLTVVEEGLLRLVQAGVTSPERCVALLGCSFAYVSRLIQAMSDSAQGRIAAPLLSSENSVRSTSAMGRALEKCERADIKSSDVATYRDAMFDHWIDFGTHSFRTFSLGDRSVSPSRWLGSQANPSMEDEKEVVAKALEVRSTSGEILECQMDTIGHLEWVLFHIGCYKSQTRETGRILLFNPSEDDQPITSLSSDFEHMLRSGELPPFYYADDSVKTAATFWRTLIRRIRLSEMEVDLNTRERHLVKARDVLGKLQGKRTAVLPSTAELELSLESAFSKGDELISQSAAHEASKQYLLALQCYLDVVLHRAEQKPFADLLDAMVHVKQENLISSDDCDVLEGLVDCLTSVKDDAPSLSGTARGLLVAFRQLVKTALGQQIVSVDSALEESVSEAQTRVSQYERDLEDLRAELAVAPSTRHLKTDEHPSILRDAIANAKAHLIIISPWIKKKILDRHLKGLDSALTRGCEIWIGYGMPPSTFHKDKSDDSALQELQKRVQKTGKLHLVEFSTHEKVLIQDADQMVTTSFNWLSYDGKDGVRRESGILQLGGVEEHRDTFLRDLKEAHAVALAKSGRASAVQTLGPPLSSH